jgi:hypothetical protein
MTDDEERALDLIEAARKKLARASGFVPDMAADFAETLRDLEDLAEDVGEDDEDDDGEDDED